MRLRVETSYDIEISKNILFSEINKQNERN